MKAAQAVAVLLLGGLVAPGCNGGEPTPAPGTPAQQPPPSVPQAPPVAADTVGQDTVGAQRTGLLREVFSYRGAGRDPFRSLLASGDVRPLIDDLRVMTIVYDPRYPARSVAVLRDVSVNKRYDVRVDDELGRLRVVAIRQDEVVFILEEFGAQRQVSLAFRRRQEGVP